MKIGLIIPYKNAAEWLPRCLNSIGSQPFEVYLVNDHSVDDSHVIATECALSSDNVLPLWLGPDQHGASIARNEGIIEAIEQECDYITFLDADDELAPKAYEIMIKGIEYFPESPIIQFNHLRQRSDGTLTSRCYNRTGDYNLNRLPGLWVLCWNKLYKTECVETARFRSQLRHGEDELFNLEALSVARRISNYDKSTVIHHTDNPNSLSKQTTAEDLILEQQALLEFLKDYNDDPELCDAVRRRMIELWNNPVYKKLFGGT